jgi:hypothetical protein
VRTQHLDWDNQVKNEMFLKCEWDKVITVAFYIGQLVSLYWKEHNIFLLCCFKIIFKGKYGDSKKKLNMVKKLLDLTKLFILFSFYSFPLCKKLYDVDYYNMYYTVIILRNKFI